MPRTSVRPFTASTRAVTAPLGISWTEARRGHEASEADDGYLSPPKGQPTSSNPTTLAFRARRYVYNRQEPSQAFRPATAANAVLSTPDTDEVHSPRHVLVTTPTSEHDAESSATALSGLRPATTERSIVESTGDGISMDGLPTPLAEEPVAQPRPRTSTLQTVHLVGSYTDTTSPTNSSPSRPMPSEQHSISLHERPNLAGSMVRMDTPNLEIPLSTKQDYVRKSRLFLADMKLDETLLTSSITGTPKSATPKRAATRQARTSTLLINDTTFRDSPIHITTRAGSAWGRDRPASIRARGAYASPRKEPATAERPMKRVIDAPSLLNIEFIEQAIGSCMYALGVENRRQVVELQRLVETQGHTIDELLNRIRLLEERQKNSNERFASIASLLEVIRPEAVSALFKTQRELESTFHAIYLRQESLTGTTQKHLAEIQDMVSGLPSFLARVTALEKELMEARKVIEAIKPSNPCTSGSRP